MSKPAARISFVVLYVKDLDMSTAFYRDILGFPVRQTDEGYVEFATEGVPLALLSFSAAQGLTGKDMKESDLPPHFSLSLGEVADVDNAYRDLSKAGVSFLKPPHTQPWGQRTAHLLDPDGNMLEIFTWEKKEP